MASLQKVLLKSSSLGFKLPLQIVGTAAARHSSISSSEGGKNVVHRNRRNHQVTRCLSSDTDPSKFLTHSTMVVQDGTGMEELPVLIRLATRDSFPFTSHAYSGERMVPDAGISEATVSFSQMLQECESVQDVFELLEAPSDRLDGFSATFALERLHTLKDMNKDWRQIHSFIRSSLMSSLYDTVGRDIGKLSNPMLVTLVNCYLEAQCFPTNCVDTINKEIQVRLGEGAFTVAELLALSRILQSVRTALPKSPAYPANTYWRQMQSQRTQSRGRDMGSANDIFFDRFSSMVTPECTEKMRDQCTELHADIWAHLALRYDEVDSVTLPTLLHQLTPTHRPLAALMENRLQHVWTQLSASGVHQCLDSLQRLRLYSPTILSYLGRWAYVNVHLLTEDLLLAYLNTFLHLKYLDVNLASVVERCLVRKGNAVETDVLAMCVEYLRANRFLSPPSLDAAATHFTQHWESYQPLHMFAVLRAFGHLNYLPANSSSFMETVERCLLKHFDNIEPDHLLEILGSFTFVHLTPTNFHKMISADDFFKKVGDLPQPKKSNARMWLKVLRHAWAHSAHTDTAQRLQWVLSRKGRQSLYCYLDSQMMAIKTLREHLEEIVGPGFYHVVPFYGCCALYLDKDGLPQRISKSSHTGFTQVPDDVVTKLVLLLRSADQFIVNTGQLLGPQESRMRQLADLGFIIVELRAGELIYNRASDFLKAKLSPFVDFEEVENRCLTSTGTGTDSEDQDMIANTVMGGSLWEYVDVSTGNET